MTDTTSPETPEEILFEEGTQLRLTRDVPIEFNQTRAFSKGTTFIVEEYVTAKESDDGKAFYWGNSRPGNMNDICAPADAVELVKSKAQMEARTIPTRNQILELLSSAVMDSGNGFSINETNRDQANGMIECSGETDDGLTFAFHLTVTNLQETDF